MVRLFWLLLFVGNLPVASFAQAPWQSVETIRQAALSVAESKLQRPGVTSTFHVGALDTRHRLPRCDRPLLGFLLPNTRLSRDTTVGVRCSGRANWQVYVPIQVISHKQVLVTTRPLARGTQVTPEVLRLETRSVNGRDYLSDFAGLEHLEVSRDLPAGALLTRNMLLASTIIERGQSVTILTKNSGLTIRMAGTALQDGGLNQRIKIRNRSSEKELEGIVRSRQLVEIM